MWRAFDLAGARRAAERRARSVARDQVERLCRIERCRSRLAHMVLPRDCRLIPDYSGAGPPCDD